LHGVAIDADRRCGGIENILFDLVFGNGVCHHVGFEGIVLRLLLRKSGMLRRAYIKVCKDGFVIRNALTVHGLSIFRNTEQRMILLRSA